MKTYFLVFISWAGLFLHGCGGDLVDSRYVLDLPEIPPVWEALLGSPHWRIEWLNVEGRKTTIIVPESGGVEIDLPQTWASAVSAIPFWPEKGIYPGVFRPAGAIFPFDVSGKSLILSWQGGVDATLFWELAQFSSAAAGETGSEPDTPETEALEGEAPLEARAAVLRLPWNFNWPRFRELFDDPGLNAEIRADPWLADWHGIAEKIIQSGFDKRRLVPEPRSSLEVPVGCGPWIGASPFAAPLFFEDAQRASDVPVFPVRQAADTWVSAEGLLRCNTKAWIFIRR